MTTTDLLNALLAKKGQDYFAEFSAFMTQLLADNSSILSTAGQSVASSSTTSLAIGTGAKSLTVAANKAFTAGQIVTITVTADATKYMYGSVTSYDATTGALVVSVSTTAGSGTFAAWTVSVSGLIGPPGTFSVATAAEAATGTDNTKAVSPLALAGWIPALTELTSGQVDTAADFIPVYDTSGTAVKKVKPANLGAGGGAFSDIVTVTGAGTVGVTSMGKLVKATGAPYTLSLASASTLGKGAVAIKNAAAAGGYLTVNSSGGSTLAQLTAQQTAIFVSDGTNIETISLAGALMGVSTTFNPSNKGSGITLSNANKTAANSGSTGTVTLTPVLSGTKVVFGFRHVSGVISVGVATSAKSLNAGLGDTEGWGYDSDSGIKAHNSSGSAYGASYTTNDVIYVYVDLVAGLIWWAKNGVVQGGGDPAAGTGAAFTGLPSTLYGAAAFASTGGGATLLTTAAELPYPIASGFALVA